MRIYVSGPLQGAGDLAAARAFYDHLAAVIRASGHDPYVPHHNTDPEISSELSAEVVYSRDLAALGSCDAVIAHIGAPSTGVGAELAIAASSGRAVLGVKRPHERGSRFAEGLITHTGGRVSEFASDDDLATLIAAWSTGIADTTPACDPLLAPLNDARTD